jgi:hypothetical protein
MFKLLGTILAAMIALSTVSCVDPVEDEEPEDPGKIRVEARIDASIPSVLRGQEAPFSAAVYGTKDKTVTWSIEEEDRHQETNIATDLATGQTLLKVSEDEKLEALTIRAVSNANPDKSGTITVTIPIPQIEKVEISLPVPWVVPWHGKVDVGPGGEIEFSAKVTGKDFFREAITWSIEETDLAVGTVIGEFSGELTVSAIETLNRTLTVQAVSKWDDSKVGEVTVTVQEPTIKGVTVTGPEKVGINDNAGFLAVVTGTGKVNQDVTWALKRITYLVYEYEEGMGENPRTILEDETEDLYFTVQVEVEYNFDAGECYFGWCDKDKNAPHQHNVFEEQQELLRPTTGVTGIDENGRLIVDGREKYGTIKLIATSNVDANVRDEITVEIDGSGSVEPPEPGEV